MSYLSRRMREDSWPRRRPGELKVTIGVDVSRWAEAFENLAVLGYQLMPWQKRMVEEMHADPDAVQWPPRSFTRRRLDFWQGRGEPS